MEDEFDIAQEAFANSEIVFCPNKFCYHHSDVAGCGRGYTDLAEECDAYNLYKENVPAETSSYASPASSGVQNGDDEEMYLNMQYYMEYCQMNGYVTPHEWLAELKHF